MIEIGDVVLITFHGTTGTSLESEFYFDMLCIVRDIHDFGYGIIEYGVEWEYDWVCCYGNDLKYKTFTIISKADFK